MATVPVNVAIVDDDESVRRALYRLLRSDGFSATTCASAHELLEASRRQEFACLIVDVHLGRMSGLELADRLAVEHFRAPIIVITAFDDEATRASAERAGAFAYLRKPVDAKVLLDAVRRATGTPAGVAPALVPPEM